MLKKETWIILFAGLLVMLACLLFLHNCNWGGGICNPMADHYSRAIFGR